jgi:hypothetical protein
MKHPRLLLVAPLLLATALLSGTAHAAREVGLGVTYDARAPIGNFRDFVPNVSFAGFQAKWDFFPLDALSVGIEAQYQLFQRGVETNTTPIANGAVTAPTYKYTSIWSFLPTVRYYLSSGALRPYVALGTGVSSTTGGILVSDLSPRNQGVAFIVQPSIGVLWQLWSDLTPRPGDPGEGALLAGVSPRRKPMESMFGLTASITYAYTTADVLGVTDIGYAGIQLGIYAKP